MPKCPSENHGKSHQSFREDEIIWVPLINNLRHPKNVCTNTYINRKKFSYSTDVERFSDLLEAQVEDKSLHSSQAYKKTE